MHEDIVSAVDETDIFAVTLVSTGKRRPTALIPQGP